MRVLFCYGCFLVSLLLCLLIKPEGAAPIDQEKDPHAVLDHHRALKNSDKGIWASFGGKLRGRQGESDAFGSSIALSGDGAVLAVSAPWAPSETNNKKDFVGYVKVFDLIGKKWKQRGSTLWGKVDGGSFGSYVVLSQDGNILAVGEDLHFALKERPTVKVYEWKGNDWKQRGGEIKGKKGHRPLLSLSADGSRIIFEGVDLDQKTYKWESVIYTYEWKGKDGWKQVGSVLKPKCCGHALSRDGSTLAVGESEHDRDTGRVRVFSWKEKDWEQKGSTLYGNSENDAFGDTVVLNEDGSILAVSAPQIFFGNDQGARYGQVHAYEWGNSDWIPRAKIISGKKFYGQLGLSLTMSSDASTIVAGSGVGSVRSEVRVFSWNGKKYRRKGQNIEGDLKEGNFGDELAVSNDGSTIAAASPYEHGWRGYVGTYSIEKPPRKVKFCRQKISRKGKRWCCSKKCFSSFLEGKCKIIGDTPYRPQLEKSFSKVCEN